MKMKLIDISNKISKGSTPRGKVNYSKKENNYFLRVTDMIDLADVYNSEFTLSDEDINNNKMKMWPINTILVSIEGTVGKISILKKEMFFNQAVAGIIPNEEIINPRYLMYCLRTTPVFSSILKGTIMPALRLGDLSEIEIEVPSMNTQNKLVSIVDSITNKINLNNEINNNLYELMKNKFDNFIDNLDRYEESVLSKIANYKNGLAMQKYRPINELGLPVIKIREMNSGISTETERCKSDIDDEVIINNGDVLFAWSGTLCMSIWCGGKAGLNQHIFKVTSDKYPKWFYYFWTLKHLNKFIEIAAGKATTMGHIKRTELDKSTVKIPSDKSLEEADKIFTPLLNKYISNNIENRNLIQLRDTLLPKLMNGEIDLDNIEI